MVSTTAIINASRIADAKSHKHCRLTIIFPEYGFHGHLIQCFQALCRNGSVVSERDLGGKSDDPVAVRRGQTECLNPVCEFMRVGPDLLKRLFGRQITLRILLRVRMANLYG